MLGRRLVWRQSSSRSRADGRCVPCRFKIGDRMRPKPEWREAPAWTGRDPDNENPVVPSGVVRAIVPWGDCGALYVGEDHRAFAADVFELDTAG
jgi:hypothetical protein